MANQSSTLKVTSYVIIAEYQVTHEPSVRLESGTKRTASEERYTPTEASYPPEINSGERHPTPFIQDPLTPVLPMDASTQKMPKE